MRTPGNAPLPMLIRTKFSPPRLTRPLVQREAALDALSGGLTRALTLIQAPAGFGKTTLLTTWREQLLAQGMIVAWLTLDQDDNDENRFIEYLTGAFATALGPLAEDAPEFGNVGKLVSVKAHLTSIINSLDRARHEVTLMLDDYDKITDPAVHELISFLLRHTPANLHVVAATRAEPPLPLASLRARDQLVEISTDSMRFGVEDTQAFFAKSISVALSPDETRALHDATEGWVAGLQIATLAMPGRAGMNGVISAFPRQSRALSDYLAENVLTRIPPDTVDFMLRTSLLDRLNGTLCERMTGTHDAAEKLDWLVKQNMFLQPLDEEGQWYRYHGLFADFLRAQLRARLPDACDTLNLRAAEWFAEQGFWAEAVRHALDADRVDLAAEWLERCALDELRSSRVRTFLGWLQKLPQEALRQRPALRIALIWALILTVQPDKAESLIEEVEAQLRADAPANAEELFCIMRAQRVSILSMQDHVNAGFALGQQVWKERFPDNRRPARGFDWVDEAFLNAMLHLHRKVGDLDAARRVAEFYRTDTDPGQNLFMLTYRACLFATLEIQERQMRAAAQRLETALALCEQIAGRRSAAASLAAASLAGIYYEWHRFDAVEALLADRFDIIDDVCFIEPIQSAYLSLVRVRCHQQQMLAAHALLDRAENLAERRNWSRLTAACTTERIRLALQENNVAATERLLRKLETIAHQTAAAEPDSVDVEVMHLSARARVLLQACRYSETAALLDTEFTSDLARSVAITPYESALLRTLQAIAHHHAGNAEQAQECIANVLALTEHDGVIRLLADEGSMIQPVLATYFAEAAAGMANTYFNAIRAALGLNTADVTTESYGATDLLDTFINDGTLSRRESDILELVKQRMSNKQIAKLLFITPETVKWHLKNIYRKLGVSDRRLAAQKVSAAP